jgi:S1-C subfamily serine protease
MSAVVVVIDQANDIAVIKAPMQGKPLTMGCVSEVVAGNPVYTVGFPNPSIQGVEPKLTKGDINSMTGLRDDPRMFQISVPVQPGNSGGPLVNKNREVIGIITSRVSDFAVLSNSGTLPQSVNYAMKAVYLKALVESNKDLRAAVEFTGAEKVDSSNPESVIESVVLISAEK